jgi:hypothetical protein
MVNYRPRPFLAEANMKSWPCSSEAPPHGGRKCNYQSYSGSHWSRSSSASSLSESATQVALQLAS